MALAPVAGRGQVALGGCGAGVVLVDSDHRSWACSCSCSCSCSWFWFWSWSYIVLVPCSPTRLRASDLAEVLLRRVRRAAEAHYRGLPRC